MLLRTYTTPKRKQNSVARSLPLRIKPLDCLFYSGMAQQISALFSHCRVPLCTGPLSRVRANFQGAGVKFKHILTPGSLPLVRKPATSSPRGHINVSHRSGKFSTTTKTAALWRSSQGNSFSIFRGRRSSLGRVTLGVTVGASTVALVRSFHTGTLKAMAPKVNLNSAEGDWKEIKGEAKQLCCLLCQKRRKCHMTKTPVQLSITGCIRTNYT